jgi:N-acetyl-anhydromuramyl-L-alanine amidase AmpD
VTTAIIVAIHALACPAIHARPIPFGADREQLTLRYIRAHYDSAATSIAIHPEMIVVHWTSTRTFAEAYAEFTPTELPPSRAELEKAGPLNVSAHYMIDRDGTIYRLLPDSIMARHVIGLNRLALGIENVGGSRMPLTDAQLQANVALIRCLESTYPSIRYVIGHFEYGEFRRTPLWQERDTSYFTKKDDPGESFMRRLRQSLPTLGKPDSMAAGGRVVGHVVNQLELDSGQQLAILVGREARMIERLAAIRPDDRAVH